MKPFWLETITLDDDRRLTGITVVVDAPYLKPIGALLELDDEAVQNRVVRRERGDTELWVRLDRREAIGLRDALGDIPDDQPGYIPEAYDRLVVVENLIDGEDY